MEMEELEKIAHQDLEEFIRTGGWRITEQGDQEDFIRTEEWRTKDQETRRNQTSTGE